MTVADLGFFWVELFFPSHHLRLHLHRHHFLHLWRFKQNLSLPFPSQVSGPLLQAGSIDRTQSTLFGVQTRILSHKRLVVLFIWWLAVPNFHNWCGSMYRWRSESIGKFTFFLLIKVNLQIAAEPAGLNHDIFLLHLYQRLGLPLLF